MKKIKHVYDSFIPRWLGVGAITIYPYIFYAVKQPDPKIMAHEMVHCDQVQKYGWFRFYISYLIFYCAYRVQGMDHQHAYLAIPYEEEAYRLQETRENQVIT